MSNTELSTNQISESEKENDDHDDDDDDVVSFRKSLQELRDLRSQLYHAADYCETTFFNANQNKIVIENTKEYICRAVVTVVDHLGNVSARLDHQISINNPIPETQIRIDCLRQRFLSCENYADKVALPKLRWSVKMPKFHPRYISNPMINGERPIGVLRDADKPSEKLRDKKLEFDEFCVDEDVPLFLYTYVQKPYVAKNLMSRTDVEEADRKPVSELVPVPNGLCMPSKAPNPTFYFQSTKKPRLHTPSRKLMSGTNILMLIRRTNRTM